jgi:hypothetical protein
MYMVSAKIQYCIEFSKLVLYLIKKKNRGILNVQRELTLRTHTTWLLIFTSVKHYFTKIDYVGMKGK